MGKNRLQNTSVRFKDDTTERISLMAEKFDMTKTNIIRLATEAGLKALERMDSEGITNLIAQDIVFTVSSAKESEGNRESLGDS